jgi:hypothetical protein
MRELVESSDDEESSSLQPKVPEWVFDAEGLRLS